MHAERRRGRTRSRILYWFRTPPGVKVGRAALDEDAIRRIEESNPSVDFDWTAILKGQTGTGADVKRLVREGRRAPRETHPRRSAPAQPAQPEVSDIPEGVPLRHAEDAGGPLEGEESLAGAAVAAEGHGGPAPPMEAIDALGHEPPPTAAHARLGAEGVLRLRARYAEVLARISERIPDPVRREELKAQAERLNPDTWVTGDEVAAGIDSYEKVFEEMRAAVGDGRRRRRRRRGRSAQFVPETDAGEGPLPEDEAE